MDLSLRNPCRDSARASFVISSENIKRSKTLMAGLRSEIGLCDVPGWRGLPALGLGLLLL